MRFFILTHNVARRDGLKALLRQIDRRASFCDAQDWRGAARALQHFTPHLFVMDWHDGIGAGKLREFIDKHSWLPVVALIDEASPTVVQNLLREGARGVVSSMTDPRLIVVAFETVLLGGYHAPVDMLFPHIAAAAAASASATARLTTLPAHDNNLRAMPQRRQMARGLSPRQQQIMDYLCMGSTNKEIARSLGISEGTVKVHLASIFQYFGAPNRAAAVALHKHLLLSRFQMLWDRDDQPPQDMHGQADALPPCPRPNAWRYCPPTASINALPIAAEPSGPLATLPGMQKHDTRSRKQD